MSCGGTSNLIVPVSRNEYAGLGEVVAQLQVAHVHELARERGAGQHVLLEVGVEPCVVVDDDAHVGDQPVVEVVAAPWHVELPRRRDTLPFEESVHARVLPVDEPVTADGELDNAMVSSVWTRVFSAPSAVR